MRYEINKKRFKMRDLRLMTSGDVEAAMRVMAACAVDNNGDPIDQETAFAFLDELDLESFNEEADLFGAVIEEANRAAVPLPGKRR